MSAVFHSFAHLFIRVLVKWITFLGTSPGGIAAQLLTLLGTEVQGGWWRLQAWKTSWQGGLKRAGYALGAVWLCTFIVCTITTIYDDHRALVEANAKLAEQLRQTVSKTQPQTGAKLQGTINEMITGNTPEMHGTQTFLLMTIINSGEPSAVEGFWATVESAGYNGRVTPTKFPKLLRLHLPNGRVAEFQESEAIYEKTVLPVQKGAPIRGWLRYQIPGITAEQLKTSKWTVHFQDYLGARYEAIFDTKDCLGECEPMYFPGTRQPFLPKDFEQRSRTNK